MILAKIIILTAAVARSCRKCIKYVVEEVAVWQSIVRKIFCGLSFSYKLQLSWPLWEDGIACICTFMNEYEVLLEDIRYFEGSEMTITSICVGT